MKSTDKHATLSCKRRHYRFLCISFQEHVNDAKTVWSRPKRAIEHAQINSKWRRLICKHRCHKAQKWRKSWFANTLNKLFSSLMDFRRIFPSTRVCPTFKEFRSMTSPRSLVKQIPGRLTFSNLLTLYTVKHGQQNMIRKPLDNPSSVFVLTLLLWWK